VIRAFAAFALLTASATGFAAGVAQSRAEVATQDSDAPLISTTAWWEKLTVTIAGNGAAQGCLYESSQDPGNMTKCDVDGGGDAAVTPAAATSGAKSDLTRITFERRFSPGAAPVPDTVAAGDKLLGSQVMALAIDDAGRVAGCRIVARSGAMTPDYGCREASAERFQASARIGAAAAHKAYMTIVVSGHNEHIV
jgi:hypothetical protein